MCYDRLTDDDTVDASVTELLATEWDSALQNGALAAAMVLVVLLTQGTDVAVVAVSAAGALVLGTALHQAVLLVGAGVLRARARWGRSRGHSGT